MKDNNPPVSKLIAIKYTSSSLPVPILQLLTDLSLCPDYSRERDKSICKAPGEMGIAKENKLHFL